MCQLSSYTISCDRLDWTNTQKKYKLHIHNRKRLTITAEKQELYFNRSYDAHPEGKPLQKSHYTGLFNHIKAAAKLDT